MAFIPENGQGLPDANSYLPVNEARAIAEMLGLKAVFQDMADSELEFALIRATRYLEMAYRLPGAPLNLAQALKWPRGGVYNRNMQPFLAVPEQVKEATVVVAAKTGVALFPDVAGGQTQQLKKEKVGPLEFEYTYTGTAGGFPSFGEVNMLMAQVSAVPAVSTTGIGQARVAR